MSAESTLDRRGDDRDHVRLVFPATAEFVSLARFAAGMIAARAGFDVEEVQDLQLAVDELYASSGLVGSAGDVRLDLGRTGGLVTISCSANSAAGGADDPAPDGGENGDDRWELSQLLLSALVDDHGVSELDGARCVWLRKLHADAN